MRVRQTVIVGVVVSVLLVGGSVALLGYTMAPSQTPQDFSGLRPCTPPPEFVDTPHPIVAPIENLVSHTEEIVIERPLAVVLDVEAKTSLEDAIDKNSSLPHVSGTYMLTEGEFGQPGSRRVTCLSDGSTLVEQVLENDRTSNSSQYRYVVWNCTSQKARPIVYGVGNFFRSDIGGARTLVRWTYSFQLNGHNFPGILGGFGKFLFRRNFLDRQYAEMMRRSLAGSKARIESKALPGDNRSLHE